MPGRRPLPTKMKSIKGTLQKCRTNSQEPLPQGRLASPPSYMSAMAKEAWNYAVANAPAGLLTSLDASVLERWANCAGLYRQALAELNQAGVAGMVVTTPSGFMRRSPLMDVVRDLALEMKGYETEMGFTPASRTKVQVQPGASDAIDPWHDIVG